MNLSQCRSWALAALLVTGGLTPPFDFDDKQ